MPRKRVVDALRAVINAIVESVAEAGADGLPESYVYLALVNSGADQQLAIEVIRCLLTTQVLQSRSFRLYAVDKQTQRRQAS